MQTYDNWAKYITGFFVAAFLFCMIMALLYTVQIRSGLSPLLWLGLGGISALCALFFHSLNERIAIQKATSFSNKKELRKETERNYQQYKEDCGDESLADFVLQEMKYLKNDIKQYIFLQDLSLKLKEIKTKKVKRGNI